MILLHHPLFGRLKGPVRNRAMSLNDRDVQKQSSAHRSRHQITRSISELSGPIRLHRHHHHQTRDRDAPLSGAPTLQGRISLDGVKLEGMTPNMSPNSSRRPSIRSSEDVVILSQPVKKRSKEEELAAERERAI